MDDRKSDDWHDLKRIGRMKYLLNTGHLSDCSFILFNEAGERVTFYCHKFILMSVSPVFERMFNGDFQEAISPENIVLEDVSATDFKAFIECVYIQEDPPIANYSLKIMRSLIYLSKRFLVSFLGKHCLAHITLQIANHITPDEMVQLYDYAFRIDEKQILKRIRNKILMNAVKYMTTRAVYDLELEVFYDYINEFDSIPAEKIRFQIISNYCYQLGFPKCKEYIPVRQAEKIEPHNLDMYDPVWFKKEESKSKESFADQMDLGPPPETEEEIEKQTKNWIIVKTFAEKLINCIKYTTMTSFDFCVGPGVSSLLTDKKKFEILAQICVGENKTRTLKLTGNPYQPPTK